MWKSREFDILNPRSRARFSIHYLSPVANACKTSVAFGQDRFTDIFLTPSGTQWLFCYLLRYGYYAPCTQPDRTLFTTTDSLFDPYPHVPFMRSYYTCSCRYLYAAADYESLSINTQQTVLACTCLVSHY